MSVSKVTRPWKFFVCICSFLLVSGCGGVSPSLPTLPPESSSTPIPVISPVPTNTLSPTVATVATSVPTLTATEENTTEATSPAQYGPYVQISPEDLYARPEEYTGKKLMFTGVLISYGTHLQPDGEDVFILQVGILGYPRPIIVLGFEPNANLGTNDGIIIGGTGRGAYYGLDPADPELVTPVIFGEWYECNLPVDQQKNPPEFWVPFPRTIKVVENN